jgi:hypothetical protein
MCVFVYVFPRPKAGNKTSFGVVRSFFPLKFRNSKNSQLIACFRCPFPFAYIATSYGCCCSYCSCSTRVKKEEDITSTQKHKNQQGKETQKTQSQEGERLGKIYRFQH